MAKTDRLERYRDQVMAIVHANNRAVLAETSFAYPEKAGTALLMAAASVSFAASMVAKTDPRLQNAPLEAQIEDVMGLLRETLAANKKPYLAVVPATHEETDGD